MILNIKRLAEVKLQKDIDTRYLAKAAAIKFPVLIKIENGEIKPTDKTIQRIATALGVGVDCIAESKDVVQQNSGEVVAAHDYMDQEQEQHKVITGSDATVSGNNARFLLVHGSMKDGADNIAIIRQDCFTGIRRGLNGRSIIFNAVIENGRTTSVFENFDTEAAQKDRWEEVMNFFLGGVDINENQKA